MPYTFEEHDKLNRKPFADFLLSLIERRNEFRRPDSTNAYSIAIDGVYGSGKTRFLKMFESMVKEAGSYKVAYYSAWEYDLYDDALAPILSLLDRPSGVFEDQAYSRTEQRLGLKALRVLKRIGISYLSMKAKDHFGKDYEEIINDIKSLFGQEAPEPDAYDVRMKCISELQKWLEKATEDVPLIFIIDELDRCNPSFAIKTLEVAKHLLDVKNVIYIFALDMHQMRAAVKKFYGKDIDADGYLCKVFDYFTILPAPSNDEYIRQCIQSIDPDFLSYFPDFVGFAIETIRTNNCTLRFVDTFIAAFRVAWHSFIQKYDNSNAYILYFCALFLKYRYPELFLLTTQYSPLSKEDKMRLSKTVPKDVITKNYIANCAIIIAQSPKTLYGNLVDPQYDSTGEYLYESLEDYDNTEKYLHGNLGDSQYDGSRVIQISNFDINTKDECIHFTASDGTKGIYSLSSEVSFNYILYSPDMMRYEEIKHLTYGQFIHRQLEMYNPLPSEEPAQ